jgi:hypothetical protein
VEPASKRKRWCAICGVREATTRDHVPPKAIFHEPYPNNLITVPACAKCNNEGSKFDAELRVVIGMHTARDSPSGDLFWSKYALRTLARNNRLRTQILENGRRVNLKSPAGIALGAAYAVPYSVRKHSAAMNRIVRGLYFHHFGQILGKRVSVRSRPLNGMPRQFAELLKSLPWGRLGESDFFYRFGRASDSPLNSIWVLLFHHRYCVFAETRPKQRSNNALERTGKQRGPRLAAARASWPAAQLGR